MKQKPCFGTPLDYNISNEEWLAMRGLAKDQNIIIMPADKGSCVMSDIERITLQNQIDNLRIMKPMKAVVLRIKI